MPDLHEVCGHADFGEGVGEIHFLHRQPHELDLPLVLQEDTVGGDGDQIAAQVVAVGEDQDASALLAYRFKALGNRQCLGQRQLGVIKEDDKSSIVFALADVLDLIEDGLK